jgi:hypothetical protein
MLDRPHPRSRTPKDALADRARQRRAGRQRAYRQRRREAIKVYPVPLPDGIVEVLFGWHWFDGLDPKDNRAIGRAIAREIAKSTKA